MVRGRLCVMMTGICRMPQWCVMNWATSVQQLHSNLQDLVQAVVPSYSVNCLVLAMRAASLSVINTALVLTTALTVKMQVLCVQVS